MRSADMFYTKMATSLRVFALVLPLTVCGLGTAKADLLAATFSTTCGPNTTSCGGGYNIDSAGVPRVFASANVNLGIAEGSTPSVSANVTSTVPVYFGYSWSAGITYYVGVYAGENLVTDGVPVNITVTGSTYRNNTDATIDLTYAQARVSAGGQIFTACVGRSNWSSGFRQTCEEAGNPSSFNSTFKSTIHSNDEVHMEVGISADNTNAASINLSAYADPIIQIDPEFAALHPEYKLSMSNGLNAAPVPVPASIWLMISGIGGLGLVNRNRKRT